MNKDKKQEIVDEILKLSDGIFRQLLPTVPRELLEMDITMPQLKIMLILFIHGPKRMTTLASELGVTLATCTGLIDRLVERDFVVRDSSPHDRRVVLCKLSSMGQKAIGRIWTSTRDRSNHLLSNMEISKLEMFREVLQAMLESARMASTKDTESKLDI